VSPFPIRIGVLAVQDDVHEHIVALTSLGSQAVGVRRSGELDERRRAGDPGRESTTMHKLVRASS
jgi:5'-phosphate synthase pdxT subunit